MVFNKALDFFAWGAFGHFVQLGLLVVAVIALSIWKRQLHGGNKYQAAFNLLLRARQLQKKIQGELRNPLLQPAAGDSFDDWNWQKGVYMSRFDSLYDFKNRFYDESALRAEILFGDDIKPLLKGIEDKIIEIRMAYEVAYNTARNKNEYNEMMRPGKEKIEENKKLLWNYGDKDDYSLRLGCATSDLEKFLRPEIEK